MLGKSTHLVVIPQQSTRNTANLPLRHTRTTSKLFLLFNTGVNFSLRNNFANSGSFAKVSIPVHIYNSLFCGYAIQELSSLTTNSELLHLPCTQVRKNPWDFTQHFFWRVFLQQIQEWIHYASLQQFCPLGVVTSCQVRQRKRRIFNTSSVGRLEMSRQCSDWLPALGTKTTHKLIDHISM